MRTCLHETANQQVKKVPHRMCVACRTMLPKTDLMRVVKSASGNVVLDTTGKIDGRGAYICNYSSCKAQTIKKRLINRAFKANVSQEIYDSLQKNHDKPHPPKGREA